MLLLVSRCTNDEELDVIHGLISNGHRVLVFSKDVEGVFRLSREDDQRRIIPLLLDMSRAGATDGQEVQAQKLVGLLPHVHHIVNFDGEPFRVLMKHFLKRYRDMDVFAGKGCTLDILGGIETLKSRGTLFIVKESKQASRGARLKRTLVTVSMRKKYAYPVPRSSSTATGDTESDVDRQTDPKFLRLQERFYCLYKQWQKDLATVEETVQIEMESKKSAVKSEVKDHRKSREEEAQRKKDMSVDEFKNRQSSIEKSKILIREANKEVERKTTTFSGRKDREVTRHVDAYRVHVVQEWYDAFVESEVKVLQELHD